MRPLKMQLKRVAAASVGLFIVLVGLSYLDFRRPAAVESSLIETSELGWNPEENEIREGPFFPPSNDEPTALPEVCEFFIQLQFIFNCTHAQITA